MKLYAFLVTLLLLVFSATACEASTPAPVSFTPTRGAAGSPTVNFRATEALIISHIFGTLTASAPTPNPAPAATPTLIPRATATKPKATPKPANPVPPPAGAAKPTADPYRAQIPKGMGAVLVANYFGNHDVNFSIATKLYTIPPNDKTLIVLAPGSYPFSVQVPGVPEAGRSDSLDIIADQYQLYSVPQSSTP